MSSDLLTKLYPVSATQLDPVGVQVGPICPERNWVERSGINSRPNHAFGESPTVVRTLGYYGCVYLPRVLFAWPRIT